MEGQVQTTESAPVSAAPPTSTVSTPSPGAAPSESAPAASSGAKSDFQPTVSVDSFKWDEWDGESYDSFPEPIRPWAEKFGGHYRSKFDSALTEEQAALNEVREIYDQLLNGHEDPRLKEFQTKAEKHQAQLKEFETKLQAAEEEKKSILSAYEQMVKQDAERTAQKFKQQNADIFEDPKKAALLGELLEEDWELDTIPQVIRLDPEIRDQVRAAKKEGVPDSWALKLAENWKPKPSKPRAGAELVAGAAAPAPTPQMAKSSLGDAKNIEEMRNAVAARAFARSRS